jgi:hypothetical protein
MVRNVDFPLFRADVVGPDGFKFWREAERDQPTPSKKVERSEHGQMRIYLATQAKSKRKKADCGYVDQNEPPHPPIRASRPRNQKNGMNAKMEAGRLTHNVSVIRGQAAASISPASKV